MIKKSKKLMSLLLTFVMTMTMMPQSIFADGQSNDEEVFSASELPKGAEIQFDDFTHEVGSVQTPYKFVMLDNEKANNGDNRGVVIAAKEAIETSKPYLDSDRISGDRREDGEFENTYQGSDAQTLCVAKAEEMSDGLKEQILPFETDYIDNGAVVNMFNFGSSKLTADDKLYLLSAKEADEYSSYLGDVSTYLRSPVKNYKKNDYVGYFRQTTSPSSIQRQIVTTESNIAFAMNLRKNSMFKKIGDNTYKFITELPTGYWIVNFLGDDNSVLKVDYVINGQDSKAPTPPVVEGKKFSSWDRPSMRNITEDTTIKALYTVNKYEVTFRYEVNNVEREDTYMVEYNKAAEPPVQAKKEGCETVWRNEEAPQEDVDLKHIKSDMVVVADYVPNPMKVTFKVGDREIETSVPYGGTAQFPEDESRPTKKGYTFNNQWSRPLTNIKENMTVTPVFDENTYTLELYKNDGTTTKTVLTEGYEDDVQLFEQSRAGYEFLGWNTKDDGFGDTYRTEVTYKHLTDVNGGVIKLYACWKEKGDYVVKYKWPNFTDRTNVMWTESGLLKDVEPEKEGYKFNGWWTAADGGMNVGDEWEYNRIVEGKDKHSVTLYPQFLPWLTVTFETNGGSKISPVEVVKSSKVEAPEAPTKDYFRFGGWYTDAELTNLFDFNTYIEADTTLYAKWDPYDCTVTFDVNGGTPEIDSRTIPAGSKVIKPDQEPAISGKTFVGWFGEDGKLYDFNKAVAKDMTLKAEYIDNIPIISNIKVASTDTKTVKLTWLKYAAATGYEVYNVTTKKTTTITKNTPSATLSGLTSGKVYKFQVRAYVQIESQKINGAYDKTATAVTVPAKVTILAPTTKSGSVTVKWKQTTCTKYEVQLATDNKFKKGLKKFTTKNAKTLTNTFKKLKKKTKYYVRVKAITTSGTIKKEGTWSLVKNIKCK